MNRRYWTILASLTLLTPFLFTGSSGAQKDGAQPKAVEVVQEEWATRPIAKGQLLVTLHEGVKVDDLKPIFERFEAKYEVVDRIDSLNQYTLTTDHERLPELKQRLNNHPYVASASYNGVSTLSRVFNDPIFKKPADMPEDKDNWNLYRINVPDAWDVTTGGNVIAVIDSGAVLDHEDLVGRITNPHSFATGTGEMQAGMRKEKLGEKRYKNFDIRNHGTHVSVTISGNADNGAGTVGVAPGSRIMPLQAITYRHLYPDEDAGLLRAFDGAVNQAIAMAIERRAAVINMSLGPNEAELEKKWKAAKTDQEKNDLANPALARAEDALKAIAPALDQANRAGVIVVAAAGNNELPAAFNPFSLSRRVISVAASTREDQRAKFSNYGEFTTVTAPGNQIWSGFAEEGKPYTYLNGTSMACPHAAGVVSLMLAVDPSLKLADAADILIKTGRPLTTDHPIGPLINAKLAIEETQRRKKGNFRLPEAPPLIPPPDIDPVRPQFPGDGVQILRRPNPWNNPLVRLIIRIWLAFANPAPPQGGPANVRWFFNMNGQVVNNNNVLAVPRPLWFQFNFQWLVENADRLNSTNMGTLNEFLVGTLRQGKIDSAPTRVPENVRPKENDPKPPQAKLPVDPGLGKTKWTGKNKNGDKFDIDFDGDHATITHKGKTVKHTCRFNPWVQPIQINLYPEHGGDPIHGLIEINDQGEISLCTDFTKKRPEKISDEHTIALKRSDAAPPSTVIGFRDGDGGKVHGELIGAKPGDYAGEKTTLFLNQKGGVNFMIIRFPTAHEAKKMMDAYRQGHDVVAKAKAGTVQGRNGPWTLTFLINKKSDDRLTMHREINDAGNKAAYYQDVGLYRDQFLIRFEGSSRGSDLDRFLPAFEKAKALIDERFPASTASNAKPPTTEPPNIAKNEPKPEPPKAKPKPRPSVIGFQDGDAKKVHPSFSSVINDGTKFCAADMANYAGHTASAGPMTGIASRDINFGPPSVGHHWVVRKFTEPAGPKQYLAKFGKENFQGFKVIAKQVERDFIKQTLEAGGTVMHTYAFIHRDDWLVSFTLYDGNRGRDFSAESRRVAEETKKLIDERFPPE